VLFANLDEYITGPSEMLYWRMLSKSVSERPSHPVKLAPYWGLFGANTERLGRPLTMLTAGELGVSHPPLFNSATRSFNPAFVIVAGNETGIVRTASTI